MTKPINETKQNARESGLPDTACSTYPTAEEELKKMTSRFWDQVTETELRAAERDKLRQELENIANAKPRGWDDPTEFTPWAQNRARHALNSL